MHQFRSMRELYTDAKETARRFPWALISAIVGTLVMLVYVENPYDVKKDLRRYIHAAMIGNLALTGEIMFSLP